MIDIDKMLAEHKLFLISEGREGNKANLSGANLSGANLYGANLSEANLSRANLLGANLNEIKGQKIILFQFNRDYLQYNTVTQELRIGCQVHLLEHWIEKGKSIGKTYRYTEIDINNYFLIINMLKEFK